MGSRTRQFLTSLVACLPNLLFGSLMVWPSYSLSVLESVGDSGPLARSLSRLESTLVGSLPPAGAMLGSALAPALLDSLGRRNTVLLISVPFILSWCCVTVARWAWLLLVARVLGGMGGGAAVLVAPVFISETAEERMRGALASISVWLYCAGVLLSYSLGWACSYRTVALVNLALAITALLLAAWLRDTPSYLLRRCRDSAAALDALAFYRARADTDKDVAVELAVLQEQLLPKGATELCGLAAGEKAEEAGEGEPLQHVAGSGGGEQGAGNPPAPTGWRYLRGCAGSRRALLLGSTIVALQSWMGLLAVQVYARDLFSSAAPSLPPDLCSVLLALVMLLGALTAGAVVDRAGRRVLLVWLSSCVAVLLAALGSLLQYRWGPAWLLPLTIFVFCFVFNLGPGTVPFVMLAELFVPEVQGVCTSLIVMVLWVANSVLLGLFPLLETSLGPHGVFYLFSCVAAVTAAGVARALPETRGQTPQQLLRIFTHSTT